MDVRYINPFLTAVENTFKTVIFLPLEIGPPLIKKNKRTTHAISGVIKVNGPVVGCVTISMDESATIKVASALIGERLENINDTCTDAISQFFKRVADDAHNLLQEDNSTFSDPELIFGTQKVPYPEGLPIIMIPCETMKDQFSIEIAIKQQPPLHHLPYVQ